MGYQVGSEKWEVWRLEMVGHWAIVIGWFAAVAMMAGLAMSPVCKPRQLCSELTIQNSKRMHHNVLQPTSSLPS